MHCKSKPPIVSRPVTSTPKELAGRQTLAPLFVLGLMLVVGLLWTPGNATEPPGSATDPFGLGDFAPDLQVPEDLPEAAESENEEPGEPAPEEGEAEDALGEEIPIEDELQPGLRAEYRSDTVHFLGEAETVRVDTNFHGPFGELHGYNFINGPGGDYPFPSKITPNDTNENGLADCAFTARWTGYIKSEIGGTFQFRVEHDDDCRIWVDGEEILSVGCCGDHSSQEFSLEADSLTPVEIRYTNRGWEDAYLKVMWNANAEGDWKYLTRHDLRTP